MEKIRIEKLNCTVLKSNIKNDCVTRTFALLFFKDDYDKAETFLRENLGKPEDNGVASNKLQDFLTNTDSFKQKEIIGMGDEKGDIHLLSENINSRTKEKCSMTVGAFLKQFPKGTYLLTTKDHCFSVKDGEIFGNMEDAQHPRKRLDFAFQIKWK